MSKQSIPILSLTFKASGNVSSRRAIGFNGAQATVQGQKVFGVSRAAVGSGSYGDAAVAGTAVVEAGAAFAVGASLIVDNQGRAIAATGKLSIVAGATPVTSSAANGITIFGGADLPEFVFADAIDPAIGSGALVEVLLRR